MPKKKTAQKSPKNKFSKNRASKLIIGILLIALAMVAIWYANPQAPNLPAPPLKDLAAEHGVRLGMLTYAKRLNVQPYTQILTSQYSFVVSDGEMHWDKFRPSATTYNFKDVDKLVNFAAKNHMPVQGHHLVWNEDDSLPAWLKNGNYSKQQLLQIMHDHITTTVSRYKGRVTEWTVVNEPFTRERHTYGLDNWWGDHLAGTDYIDKAFIWAHEADPNAKLILNDFNNETEGEISDAQYAYLQRAKQKGIPIDGIGMQLHIDANQKFDKNAVIKNMQRFKSLGYPVYITEFDVRKLASVPGTDEYRSQLEAKLTAQVVRACVESKSCVSFVAFGQTDNTALSQLIAGKRSPSRLFTSRYQPKEAFYAFRNAWQEQ